MFLKALNTKATGALHQVAELKKDMKKSENVAHAQALIKKIATKDAAKAKAALAAAPAKPEKFLELLQEQEYPLMEALMEAHDDEDRLQELATTKEANVKLQNKDACACNGAMNMNHHGSSCRDWEGDGSQAWCYVSWACSDATPSAYMSGAKWATCTAALPSVHRATQPVSESQLRSGVDRLK